MGQFCSEVHDALPANPSHLRTFRDGHVFQEAVNFLVACQDNGTWKSQGLVSIDQVLKWTVRWIADLLLFVNPSG